MTVLALPDSPHQELLPAPTSAPRRRVDAIDVARGLLMCVITVGHGLILLNDSESNKWLGLLITKVTNLGTPGFTMISGMLLGYFESTYSHFQRIRWKYFIRGIQLLTLAHLLISLATYPLRQETSLIEVYLRYWYITDALAVLFMLLPTLVPRLDRPARIVIGITCLLSWKLFSFFPSITSPILLVIKEFTFGVSLRDNPLLGDTYPIVPLAGLFMIGTVLGNSFARSIVSETLGQFVRTLRRSIVPLILLSGFLVGLWAAGKFFSEGLFGNTLKTLFYPEKLSSLLPFYIGVLFLILAYFVRKIEMEKNFGRFEKALALFGKTSLFTYVVQYFLVQTIPALIGWRNQLNIAEWTLYLGGTFMILFYLARIYNDSFLKGWNRSGKAKRRPSEMKRKKALTSPDISPELLNLKKDLW
ncbi:MAG: DUF1624 domain-containing protein [Candidatus Manganitrophus sp. SB1]|nr:DUF1624 domain-containing protein [Candidatus Manganitrophus morganii]